LRANPAEYELVVPETLQEALRLESNEPGSWMPIAGGTDVMVLYAAGKLQARKLVSIGGLRELRNIEVTSAEVRIGAGCTYTDLRQDSVIAKEFPLLTRAAAWTGGIANQNRGTLGGNIANASPAGDSLPVLLVYDADLILLSARGERRIPYRTFHTGYKKTLLAPDELIHRICVSRTLQGYIPYAKKVGARNAQAISKVFLAAMARISNTAIEDVRLAAGSVGPIPMRLAETERALAGRTIDDSLLEMAGEVMAKEIQPIDDIRSTANYRTAVLRNLLGEFLRGLPGARIAS
jgi:CO/xanthine dehydrogenase FAD-binding subunit